MKLLAEKIKALVKALQATKKTKRRIKRKKKVRDRKSMPCELSFIFKPR